MSKISVVVAILMGILSSDSLKASPVDLATSFDRAPWISARAAALNECLSPFANGLDAFYYNPALIGGPREKSDKPYLTHLFIPYLGNASSPGGNEILSQQMSGESLDGPVLTQQFQDAWSGKRSYASVSATPVVLLNRFMFGYTMRSRTGSYLQDDDPLVKKIHVGSETQSGPIMGFSAMAPKNDFYLGVSAAYLKTTTIDADLDSAAFGSAEDRKKAFQSGKISYDGLPIHIGMLYRFSNFLKPSLTAVVGDVGSTRYSPSDKSKETKIEPQRITLGLGISPMISTWGTLHVGLEASDAHRDRPQKDNLRASAEFTIGNRYGADSGLSIRLGYSIAGISYGGGLNLGLFSFQIASLPEDIGRATRSVIERRSVLNLGINIADY